jgi:hypothetical protein
VTFEKGPGYDWTVSYQCEDQDPEEMSVFGQIRIEDAVREARYSLDGINNMNVGTYAILGVHRQ